MNRNNELQEKHRLWMTLDRLHEGLRGGEGSIWGG